MRLFVKQCFSLLYRQVAFAAESMQDRRARAMPDGFEYVVFIQRNGTGKHVYRKMVEDLADHRRAGAEHDGFDLTAGMPQNVFG